MDNDRGLYAAFFEATNGVKTAQWMLFPTSLSEHGSKCSEGLGRFMKRRLDYADHRAKWATTQKPNWRDVNRKLSLELDQYESTGWVLRQPIVIALEVDDYQKAWENEFKIITPYKALRHVNKVALSRGYKVV